VEGLATHSLTERFESYLGWKMIPLTLNGKSTSSLHILCLGSHPDAIEIGCGGTVLWLAEHYPSCVFHWVVFSAVGDRAGEAQRAACLFAGTVCPHGPLLRTFPDGLLPYVATDVKAFFEELKQAISPDLEFTHNRHDAHQDHRLIAELTWNTFRDHLILEHEIPKYDGDLGQPSLFVPFKTVMPKKGPLPHAGLPVTAREEVVRTGYLLFSCGCEGWSVTLRAVALRHFTAENSSYRLLLADLMPSRIRMRGVAASRTDDRSKVWADLCMRSRHRLFRLTNLRLFRHLTNRP
jgi:LmbE family N-acetylglucosaminyl deacetylase